MIDILNLPPMENYGDGLTRTASGRQTYAPDGIMSRQHTTQLQAHTGSSMPTSSEQSRSGSISGTTTAQSRKSSVSKDEKTKDDGHEVNCDLTKEKSSMPAGLTAGMNEENFSSEADVEMQKERNQRDDDGDKDEKKDPNLVEWDGPDDPVSIRTSDVEVVRQKIPQLTSLRETQ